MFNIEATSCILSLFSSEIAPEGAGPRGCFARPIFLASSGKGHGLLTARFCVKGQRCAMLRRHGQGMNSRTDSVYVAGPRVPKTDSLWRTGNLGGGKYGDRETAMPSNERAAASHRRICHRSKEMTPTMVALAF